MLWLFFQVYPFHWDSSTDHLHDARARRGHSQTQGRNVEAGMPSRWDPTTINRLVQSEFHICTLKSYFIDPPLSYFWFGGAWGKSTQNDGDAEEKSRGFNNHCKEASGFFSLSQSDGLE